MGSFPTEVENLFDILKVFSDGSVARSDPSFDITVEDDGFVSWKHVEFDASHGLSLRLYKPLTTTTAGTATLGKLPIFFYFHGGGFCVGSCAWPHSHNYCIHLARRLQVIVVAPDYRLAPENRLPAAIEDGMTALLWLRDQAVAGRKSWLAEVADFGRVVICGDSAGGTIAHHLAVRLGPGSPLLEPVRVRGYVLLAPFFGGSVRTKSELECPEDAFFNLIQNDRFWKLSLPLGADRDHPFSNPFGPASPSLESVTLDPILVVVGGTDLLRDRVEEYVKKLKGWGKQVEFVEFKVQQHGFSLMDPSSEASEKLNRDMERFISETTDSCLNN